MHGVVVGLHVNPKGGVPKHPVEHLRVETNGCVGDKQNDVRYHGGPTRAVCLMEYRIMTMLQEQGHPIGPGTTGENLLVDGLPAGSLEPGTVLQVGSSMMRITTDAPPCKTIRASFSNHEFKALSHKQTKGVTRWYAEVLEEATVNLGDPVSIISGDVPVGSR